MKKALNGAVGSNLAADAQLITDAQLTSALMAAGCSKEEIQEALVRENREEIYYLASEVARGYDSAAVSCQEFGKSNPIPEAYDFHGYDPRAYENYFFC